MWEFSIYSKKILLFGSNILQEDFSFLLYMIQLVLGGLSAFFAILLCSKTRDLSFISLVIAILSLYAGIVYKTLVKMGVIVNQVFLVFGIPFLTLFFTVVPYIFFLVALITLFFKLSK